VSMKQLVGAVRVRRGSRGTTPINLLTPSDPTATIQVSPGGRILLGSAARAWIRGTPAPDADPLDYFFDLPADEQREAIGRIVMSPREDDEPSDVVMRRMWWFGDDDGREEYISRVLSDLRRVGPASEMELARPGPATSDQTSTARTQAEAVAPAGRPKSHGVAIGLPAWLRRSGRRLFFGRRTREGE
jgi:hypothetical protein